MIFCNFYTYGMSINPYPLWTRTCQIAGLWGYHLQGLPTYPPFPRGAVPAQPEFQVRAWFMKLLGRSCPSPSSKDIRFWKNVKSEDILKTKETPLKSFSCCRFPWVFWESQDSTCHLTDKCHHESSCVFNPLFLALKRCISKSIACLFISKT